MIQVSTSAVEFWKPMGFEPVIGRKDVTVFAIYEEAGSGMHDTVGDWLKMMATTYQVRLFAFATSRKGC
jgi:mediator of RNA polymerase II transcription subunit 13